MEIMHHSVSLWFLKRTFYLYGCPPFPMWGTSLSNATMEILVAIIPYVPSDFLLESICKLFHFKTLSSILGKAPMLMLYFTTYLFLMISLNAFLILLLHCHTVPEFACPSAFRIVVLICMWVTSYELHSSAVGLMDEMTSKCCQG